jgi:hypothetical protein
MKFKTRVFIIIVVSLLGLFAQGLLGLYSMRESMMTERQAQITQLLDFVDAQLQYFYSLEVSGKLTHEEAQARAKEAIGAQRVGSNYFFIRSLDNENFVLHPIASRMGKPDNGGKVPDGRTVVQAYWDGLAASKDNKAFLVLTAPKPGDADKTKLYQKLNGVVKFRPWGWMPGIGFYIDDIDTHFWKQSRLFLAVGAALFMLVTLLVFRMRSTILRQLGGEPQDAANSMKKIASGDLSVAISVAKDDNTSLMASLKLMQMKLTNLTSAIHENAVALTDQVQTFDGVAKSYTESKAAEDLINLNRSIQRIGKTAEVLKKSIARFRL